MIDPRIVFLLAALLAGCGGSPAPDAALGPVDAQAERPDGRLMQRPDAAVLDAAVVDAAIGDAAVSDAAVPDAPIPDAAVPDAAVPDAASATGPYAYGVSVDFSRLSLTARQVYGVNEGPLQIESSTSAIDYSALYTAAGIASVRFHGDILDITDIYTDATLTADGAGVWEPNDPSPSALDDPAHYDFTDADREYASVAGNWEPYMDLGESEKGARTTTHPAALGTVGANITLHYAGKFDNDVAFAAPPAFVEIWNEPDNFYWTASVTSFKAVHDAAYTALSGTFTEAALGGAGFTSDGTIALPPAAACTSGDLASHQTLERFIDCYLRYVRTSTGNFVSFHYYGRDHDGHLTTPSEVMADLLHEVAELETYSSPILHMTEWNLSLGRIANPELFTSARVGAFTSAMFSWLQAPELAMIKRAHFFAGARNPMAMLLYGDQGTATLCDDGSGKTVICFQVRASALALSLHHDLAGLPVAAAGLARVASDAAWAWPAAPLGVIAGAQADYPVTAVAVDDGTTATVVITNFGEDAETVHVRLRGLHLRNQARRRLLSGYDARHALVRPTTSGADIVPRSDDIATVFGRFIVPTTETLTVVGGTAEWTETLSANSALRVDVRAAAWP